MPDLTFILSGDNLILKTEGGERLEQIDDFTWSFVEGTPETVEFLPALATVGASYHAIYSTKRLLPSYTGPVFRGIRNSDSVAVDVAFTGNTVALADIAALRGAGPTLRLDKWYNQAPNAVGDMLQTDADRRPGVHEAAYHAGAPVILIDGGIHFNAVVDEQFKGFDFTHSLSGGDCTIFLVTDFHTSTQFQLPSSYAGDSGPSGGRVVYKEYSNDVLLRGASISYGTPTSTSAWPGTQFRAAPAVYAFREDAGPVDMFIDGLPAMAGKSSLDMASPGGAPLVETLTDGKIGFNTNPGLTLYNTNMRFLAYVAVEGALSDADVDAVSRVLQANFAIPFAFDRRVSIIGDSIGEGPGNTNTLELMWHLRQQDLTGRPELYNVSISGKKLAGAYADRALFDATLYTATMPLIYVLQAGTNDLRDGATAAGLHATLVNYVAYLHGLGSNAKVVVNTILKSGDATGLAVASVVAAYNALVRADTAGADAINDVDASLAAVDPAYWTNTAILIDLLHPTSYGQSLLAIPTAAAINAALA